MQNTENASGEVIFLLSAVKVVVDDDDDDNDDDVGRLVMSMFFRVFT